MNRRRRRIYFSTETKRQKSDK